MTTIGTKIADALVMAREGQELTQIQRLDFEHFEHRLRMARDPVQRLYIVKAWARLMMLVHGERQS
jgi:hypothetical protein